MGRERQLAEAVIALQDAIIADQSNEDPDRQQDLYWAAAKAIADAGALAATILSQPEREAGKGLGKLLHSCIAATDKPGHGPPSVEPWNSLSDRGHRTWDGIADAFLESASRVEATNAEREAGENANTDALQAAEGIVGVLRDRVAELEGAIAKHRDQKGDDRCWRDDIELYQSIGDASFNSELPPQCEFLESCKRFWMQRQTLLDKPAKPGMTIAQLEARIAELEAKQCHAAT